jgi:hypothetical protein
MKNVWHYIKAEKELVSRVKNRKVAHVVQQKITSNSYHYFCWSGEFADDDYFRVYVYDGIVMLVVSDREGELKTKTPVSVAMADEVIKISLELDPYKAMKIADDVIKNFFPKFAAELTFEEIMEIFMWEYASPNVEVYEHIFS